MRETDLTKRDRQTERQRERERKKDEAWPEKSISQSISAMWRVRHEGMVWGEWEGRAYFRAWWVGGIHISF